MSVHKVMWIGIALVFIGVIGLVGLSAEPLMKAVKTVFFKQRFAQDEEREDIAIARKTLKKPLRILIIIGLILFVPSAVMLYAPRGFDSIFSQEAEGAAVGAHKQNRPEGGQSEEGFAPEESQDHETVIVAGETLYFNGRFFEDMEEFEVYLDSVDQIQEMKLKDDYAIATTFHQTESILKEKGIKYVYFEETKGSE